MSAKSLKVHIVGGGVSGLVAAQVLEKHGAIPIIIEATDRVGGRLKTDIIDGFQLDRGFQVLLSSYSAAKKYLDYKALELQELRAGSCIFINGKQKFFGDPLRDFTLFFPTLFSGIGNMSDKIKIAKLNFRLQKKTIAEIFEGDEITTKQYLDNLGFSKNIIQNFFLPFFSGIFLENSLKTPSRMFEFVFKMFGEGLGVLPKGGIEDISKQLKEKLQSTEIHYNTLVSKVKNKVITLSNGKKIESHYIIIATEPSSLVENLKKQQLDWKSCENLYFTCANRVYDKAFIGLVSNKESLINNIFYPTSLKTIQRGKSDLISVTVVKKHGLSEKDLINQVKIELKKECKIENARFLKLYNIPKALPEINNLQYEIFPSETKLKDGVFLAGDVLLNGSLNAAIIAGEKAALGVIEDIEKTITL